jgi:LmbE family N-acetylglucosaminyl deacetylase
MTSPRAAVGEKPPRPAGERACRSGRAAAVVIASLALIWAAVAMRRGTSLPLLEVPHPGERLVVLAPHPDDETLATGGMSQRAMARGANVRVVFLTSGDGFRVAAAALTGREQPQPADYLRLGSVREGEARAAARRLGLSEAQLTFLHYPDQGLLPLWLDRWDGPEAYVSLYTRQSAIPAGGAAPRHYLGARLLADLRALLSAERPTTLCLPAAEEGTADHWSAHLFGISALAQAGMLGRVRVLTYLVHHDDWPGWFRWPGHDTLQPPGDLPPASWRSFPLTGAEQAAKRAALEEYHTQTAVMGGRLRRFNRPNELFAPLVVHDLPAAADLPAGHAVPAGKIVLLQQGERLQARFALRRGGWGGAQFHLHLLTREGKVRWDFRPGVPPPAGGESRVQDGTWEVSVPLPAETPLCGVWVGAERFPPGGPPENLGWLFYAPPRPDQSKITPRASVRSRASAA